VNGQIEFLLARAVRDAGRERKRRGRGAARGTRVAGLAWTRLGVTRLSRDWTRSLPQPESSGAVIFTSGPGHTCAPRADPRGIPDENEGEILQGRIDALMTLFTSSRASSRRATVLLQIRRSSP